MPSKRMQTCRRIATALVLIGIGLPILLAMAGTTDVTPLSDHEVHIAFGFHVNLYHSFRNDTNDEDGFGKDIRIIRRIIRTLDRYNAKGVPVKGVWDFDNLFSLQEILPQYAPDIISDIRRRVANNGDEVILMSYNNGLVSAMTEQELDDAVRWAISNPWQSGVKDLFGTYTPIVRPQEMMTTPGNFSIYRKHGIEAVALYYSATPFDAFRVFSRRLTREEAHNPVRYRHPQTGEEMVIVPSYHIGDLVEHVSLKSWVGELQRQQDGGRLNRDALLFINYDADSELWSGIDMPWPLKWLPNTSGLAGLIEEVSGLDRVRFTTVGDYLEDHPPVGTFHFSQDTADGSYNGYNSWAEKAAATRYWTHIQRSRSIRSTALKVMPFISDPGVREEIAHLIALADMKRLRALSTTNFGMATPFLARQRQQAMSGIVDDLNRFSNRIEALTVSQAKRYLAGRRPRDTGMASVHGAGDADLVYRDTLMVLQPHPSMGSTGNRFVSVPISGDHEESTRWVLVGEDGKRFGTIRIGSRIDRTGRHRHTLYVDDDVGITDGVYHLFADRHAGKKRSAPAAAMRADDAELSNQRLAVRFTPGGTIEGIYLDRVRQADRGSLIPYLTYGRRTRHAQAAIRKHRVSEDGGAASVTLTGALPAPSPHGTHAGWMDYRLSLVGGLPYLLVEGGIDYPATERNDLLKSWAPGLKHRADMQWREVAPAEIRFTPRSAPDNPIRILKRNYLDVESAYRLDYFRHDARNRELDNINNHITSSYVGVVSGERGLAVAQNNRIQSNFAFAPLKMHYHRTSDDFSISVNPFGTYHGRQYHPPTWGNRQGYDITLLTGEQFSSAGPTYNGESQQFAVMIAFFQGQRIPDRIKKDLIGYAHMPTVVSATEPENPRRRPEPLDAPQGLVATDEQERVRFNWDPYHLPDTHYRIHCGTRPGHYEQVYPATGSTVTVAHYRNGRPFVEGETYYAYIEAVGGNGQRSRPSSEIRFTPGSQEVGDRQEPPLALELKVLWANLRALLINSAL